MLVFNKNEQYISFITIDFHSFLVISFIFYIIPDILDPVLQPDPTLMNRAFWRQNTRIHFTRSAPPLYILDPVLQPDPITFLCI